VTCGRKIDDRAGMTRGMPALEGGGIGSAHEQTNAVDALEGGRRRKDELRPDERVADGDRVAADPQGLGKASGGGDGEERSIGGREGVGADEEDVQTTMRVNALGGQRPRNSGSSRRQA